MTSPSTHRCIRVPEHVLTRELDGELVILNLDNERYYGLDDVGARFWSALTDTPDLEGACDRLIDEFDVPPETLRADLDALVEELIEQGIVETAPPA